MSGNQLLIDSFILSFILSFIHNFFFFFFGNEGWGKTSSLNNSSFAEILQEAKMPIVDYATCAAGNANLTYAKVDDETMICAGYGGDSVVSCLS